MNTHAGLKISALIMLIMTLTLSACTGGSQPELEGSTWELVAIDDKLPLAGTTITLVMEDGQSGGTAGCNSYGAAYVIEDDTLTFDEVVSTMMYCEAEGVMDQETAYLLALSQVKTYTITGGALYLTQEDGRQLKFIPQ
ncbi:MAG: META domain-containing protein [Anaerolineaceae bacterium]|jgi:heat shock protein HslJ